MAPVELAAAGRPTIAYRVGGATETIIEGVTGIFFERQETADLVQAIKRFEQQEWSPTLLRRHAEGFGVEVFKARFRRFLAQVGAPITEDTAPAAKTPEPLPNPEPALAGMPRRAAV